MFRSHFHRVIFAHKGQIHGNSEWTLANDCVLCNMCVFCGCMWKFVLVCKTVTSCRTTYICYLWNMPHRSNIWTIWCTKCAICLLLSTCFSGTQWQYASFFCFISLTVTLFPTAVARTSRDGEAFQNPSSVLYFCWIVSEYNNSHVWLLKTLEILRHHLTNRYEDGFRTCGFLHAYGFLRARSRSCCMHTKQFAVICLLLHACGVIGHLQIRTDAWNPRQQRRWAAAICARTRLPGDVCRLNTCMLCLQVSEIACIVLEQSIRPCLKIECIKCL